MESVQEFLARLALLVQGSWDVVSSRLKVAQWSFAPGGSVMISAGCAFALVLAILCYYRTTEGLTVRSRLALASLRFTSVLVLLIMASGVVCAVDIASRRLPQMLVVLDDSPSMSLPDGSETRFGRAQSALWKKGLLEQLQRTDTVRVVRTSGAQANSQSDPGVAPQNLAHTLVRAASEAGDEPLAHILLISDGAQLGSENLVNAASELPAPVSVLSVGDGSEIRDVILESVSAPQFVYQNDRALISAQVRSVGMEGEAVAQLVQVIAGTEKEIATSKVTLKPGDDPAMVRVEFVTPTAGLQQYILRVLPVNGELTPKNNGVAFHLDVRDEKIRVLFIEGEPSWEYKFVKQALEADPVMEFYGLVRLPGDEWFYQGKATRPDGKPVIRNPKGGFPDSLDELNYFDVLILGDLERKIFEQSNRFELLDSFVKNRGGGLVTIGGFKVYTAGNYDGSPLARLIPFDLTREKKQQLINRFNVQVTTQGIMHPAMQLEFDPVKNEEAWSKLPWVEGGNAFRAVKAGATTLMVHPKLKTNLGPRPIAAAWQCGSGRVFSSALDGTWHWRLARTTDNDYHQRFWGQTVRWLAGDPRMHKALGTLISEDPVIEVGKPATFSLTLKDKDGNFQSDAIAEFTLEEPSGEKLLARSAADPAVPGRYALTFTPRAFGAHRVKISIQRTGQDAQNQERTFQVAPSRAEFVQIAPDTNALSALAKATGGTSAPLSAFSSLQLPGAKSDVKIQRMLVNVWQAPGLLILLVFSLSTEWLLRKRRGLA